jgi:hypothetical protein
MKLIKKLEVGDKFLVTDLINTYVEDILPEMEYYSEQWLTVESIEPVEEDDPYYKNFYYYAKYNSYTWGELHMNIEETNDYLLKQNSTGFLSTPSLPKL